jgi:hypothetical protein
MIAHEKVRFRNEAVFEEAEPPKDRSRPLEWRRSFNYLVVTARQPFVSYLYTVNDREMRWSEPAEGDHIPPDIKPDLVRRLQINARIDVDDCRDTVLQALEKEKGSGLYELGKIETRIKVCLVSRDARAASSVYAEGSYAGSAFFDDMNDEEEHLLVELSAPIQYLEELAAQLKQSPSLGLRICFALRSFSFEVDDALGEPYHSRELFIHGMVPAALISVGTVPAASAMDGEMAGLPKDVAASPFPWIDTHNLTSGRGESLTRITAALWVIAGALILQWLAK